MKTHLITLVTDNYPGEAGIEVQDDHTDVLLAVLVLVKYALKVTSVVCGVYLA